MFLRVHLLASWAFEVGLSLSLENKTNTSKNIRTWLNMSLQGDKSNEPPPMDLPPELDCLRAARLTFQQHKNDKEMSLGSKAVRHHRMHWRHKVPPHEVSVPIHRLKIGNNADPDTLEAAQVAAITANHRVPMDSTEPIVKPRELNRKLGMFKKKLLGRKAPSSPQPSPSIKLMTTLRGNSDKMASKIDSRFSNSESDYNLSSTDTDSDLDSPTKHKSGFKKLFITSHHQYEPKYYELLSSSKHFNEDKPWKSHKDVNFVTEQERKRYEGVWVTNRYLYLDLLPWWSQLMDNDSDTTADLPQDGLMLNLVARDIWSRSNLPNNNLAQIYELVDTRRDATLDRQSFIVGMWLVDQCLYGRKLPKQLETTVWHSVDRYGVNLVSSATLKALDKDRKKLARQELKNLAK